MDSATEDYYTAACVFHIHFDRECLSSEERYCHRLFITGRIGTSESGSNALDQTSAYTQVFQGKKGRGRVCMRVL